MLKAFVLPTLLAVGIGGFAPACARRASADPPSHVPAGAASTPGDGGLPAVPLTRKGVITPSDVKLEPGPRSPERPSSGLSNTTATPNAN